jgi:hypothetical protein
MLKINKFYRRGYNGEDIIQERVLENQTWRMVTEHVPNNVVNEQISNRALVIGNGQQRLDFKQLEQLVGHHSGLLGAQTLQIYGCNALYRDINPDFLVVTSREMAREVVDTGYTKDNVVYTRVDITLEFPKEFYLIPHDLYADAGTTALYLACFDGHKTVFMLGFDNQDTPGINNNVYAGTPGYDPRKFDVPDIKWINNKTEVFRTYNDVDFVIVTLVGQSPLPKQWKDLTNVRQINYRDFTTTADL